MPAHAARSTSAILPLLTGDKKPCVMPGGKGKGVVLRATCCMAVGDSQEQAGHSQQPTVSEQARRAGYVDAEELLEPFECWAEHGGLLSLFGFAVWRGIAAGAHSRRGTTIHGSCRLPANHELDWWPTVPLAFEFLMRCTLRPYDVVAWKCAPQAQCPFSHCSAIVQAWRR